MSQLLWTQKQDIGTAARSGAAMTFDSNRDRVVLFGGSSVTTKQIQVWHSGSWLQSGYYTTETISTSQFMNDTWEYDGVMWTRVADTGPSARFGFGFVYGDKVVLLFGGKNATNAFRDTWQWDGAHWTQRQDIGPSPRGDLAAEYDSNRGHMVIFGGSGEGNSPPVFGDTWEAFERP